MQCRSKSVVCISTPRMYPRRGYFLVIPYKILISKSADLFSPNSTQFWEWTGLKIFLFTFTTFKSKFEPRYIGFQYSNLSFLSILYSMQLKKRRRLYSLFAIVKKCWKGNPKSKLHLSYCNMTLKLFGWFIFHNWFYLKLEIGQYLPNIFAGKHFG